MAKFVVYVCQSKVSLLFETITSPGIILFDLLFSHKRDWQDISVQIFLFFAVYLIPVLCSFRASILIHKSRLSQKRNTSSYEVLLLNNLLFWRIRFWNNKRLSSTAGAIQEAKYDSLYGYNLTGQGFITGWIWCLGL